MNALWQAHERLPQGYRLKERIDLTGNRRQMKAVMRLSVGLFAIVLAVGLLIAPLSSLARKEDGFGGLALKLAALAAGMIAYIVGHEAVHGVCMWMISRVRPSFGITLMYAYAGSKVYFAKRAYVLIALMPAAVWTALLGGLCLVVPADWFWVIWLVQCMNVSGAAGDFYVAFRIGRMPRELLVQDGGTAMSVYMQAA